MTLYMLVEKGPLLGTGMTHSPPGVALNFNILVISNFIQSAALLARGGLRKGADQNHE
jgi:hypothetical protein